MQLAPAGCLVLLHALKPGKQLSCSCLCCSCHMLKAQGPLEPMALVQRLPTCHGRLRACSVCQPDQAAAARAGLPIRGGISHSAVPGITRQLPLCQADTIPTGSSAPLKQQAISKAVQHDTCRSHDFTQLMQRKKDVSAGLAADGGSRALWQPRELDKKLLAAPVPMPRSVEERIQMLGGVSVPANSRWTDLTCTSNSMAPHWQVTALRCSMKPYRCPSLCSAFSLQLCHCDGGLEGCLYSATTQCQANCA